jgi:hypothetical protein
MVNFTMHALYIAQVDLGAVAKIQNEKKEKK